MGKGRNRYVIAMNSWFGSEMRHYPKWFGAGAFALAISCAPAGAAEATNDLYLSRGHAEVRVYERTPATIILGDNNIVAANITPSDVLVLTGRARGTTNVIVLDESGGELDRFLLSVFEPGEDVAVRRGIRRQVVRCDPSCRSPEEASSAPVELTDPISASNEGAEAPNPASP